MSDIRPSIFAEASDDDVDLTRFAPKALKPPPVPAADIRRLSEESGFPSRAPSAGDRQTTVSQLSTVGSLPAPVRRPAKTGRTQLLNARVTPTSFMPRCASSRKSTVRPPWAPLTAIVTCSRPGFIAA